MVRRGGWRHGPVYEPGNFWIRFCELVLFPLTRLLGRGRYAGQQHIAVPGPVLVVGNHISHLDPMYDAVLIRRTGRLPRIMAKASLWKLPVVGRAVRGTRQIPVERGGGAGQAGLDAAIRALADGGVVLIYPEGTITRDPDLWPMRPRPGVAALALSGDFPVVPMAHWGTHEVFRSYGGDGSRRGRFRPLPRKDVHVLVGPPLDLSQWRGRPVDARAVRDVSMLIMTAVRDLVGELRGEEPPTAFFDPKKVERQQAAARQAEPPAGR
ncbi:lysophospholipid acyltransferase family protein [Nakamurella endophytica]|uniref:1-acyl-sn-glycerol-3-phosphate acyltransferase n=1 Tax=Nakamurella endophytica TaxID=1748367 RepID=A0A917SL21_9ACTN|nr:lysophospholipid acyltransferase family protein [Nakamurella endophytica]GGL84988.1 1-acyl-sn-glycerol-3-phosphate acyltransferase [Nakamurella endophytica]